MSRADEAALRQEMVELSRFMGEHGLVAGSAGNLSVRLDAGWVLTTPSGRIKARLTPRDLVVVDLEGAPRRVSDPKPSSEVRMHLSLYQRDEQLEAIVHAHPRAVTALSLRGEPWPNLCVSAEGAAAFGAVGVVDYVRPGGWELGQACAKVAAYGYKALVLLHHGAVTMGESLEQAMARMQALEHVSALWMMAAGDALASPAALPEDEARALRALSGFDPTLTLAWTKPTG